MKLKKPNFWDNKKPSLFSILLLPFTIPILINNYLNKFKQKNYTKEIKTICVGNIYIGGTGKTPTSIELNKILLQLNFKTAFIKKYYKNYIDEEKLLNKNGKLFCDTKRIDALNSAINKDFDIAIFDDGLQDNSINYDLKFVCFNVEKFIGNGYLIPAGPLRERINSLSKYDAVFLNGNNENSIEIISKIKKYNQNIKIFESAYKIINFEILDNKKKYVAFAGIGNPISFKKTLVDNNFVITKFLEYPDHYNYKNKDINHIKHIAKNLDAEIVTTEKDYLRIEENLDRANIENINFVKIELRIKNKNELIKFLKIYL
jgi:tetraacyldisaccharide 4'-kinase